MKIARNQFTCLLDSGTTQSIFNDKLFFSSMSLRKSQVTTLFDHAEIIDGHGITTFVLPNGQPETLTMLCYLFNQRETNQFKDVRRNGYHSETMIDNGKESLCITSYIMDGVRIGAYKSHATLSWNLVNPDVFRLWYDRLEV